MLKQKKTTGPSSMKVKVDGHEVTLHFAPEPDLHVAIWVKQALLSAYLPAKK